MRYFVQPITRYGVQHWVGYAVDAAGRVTWQVLGMSEAGVRTACLRRQTRSK